MNDLQLRYRRSVLGVGWSLLHPLAWTLGDGLPCSMRFSNSLSANYCPTSYAA